MKFSYTIDPQQKLVLERFTGRFTVAEIIESVRLLWTDPRFDRSFAGIVDISGMEPTHDLSDLRAVLGFLKEERARISTGRWAIVATSPLATAGAFLYQKAMAGTHPLEVFSTHEAAVEWLGLSDATLAVAKCGIV